MCIVVDICDTLPPLNRLKYYQNVVCVLLSTYVTHTTRHFFHFPPGWSANKCELGESAYDSDSTPTVTNSLDCTILITDSVYSLFSALDPTLATLAIHPNRQQLRPAIVAHHHAQLSLARLYVARSSARRRLGNSAAATVNSICGGRRSLDGA